MASYLGLHYRPPIDKWFNLTSDEFCHLLITFVNSLDPDQARQKVSPDLDLNCFTLIMFLKELFEKLNFENSQQMTTEA